MSDRNQALLRGLSRQDPLIEIGPSHAPVAAKRDGWSTTVVDHASRADLIAKYAAHANVDTSAIEEVDAIWHGGPLHALFPPEAQGRYAALIASHVIEHLPDLLGFLDSAARLLHPTQGVLSLAVPDKRWCFDILKPLSTTGQVLAAHRAGATRHGPATLFDSMAYHAADGERGGWAAGDALPGLHLHVSLEAAKATYDGFSASPDAPYVDCHAWHFTPSSFSLLILELGALGMADWRVDWIRPEPAVEFLVHLRRGRRTFASPAEREAARLALLRQTLLEERAQSDWMVPPWQMPGLSALVRRRLASALRPARAAWRRLGPGRSGQR